jgi:L-alanine-DL-glutamate epimerase-like enolase superfamily enzyme
MPTSVSVRVERWPLAGQFVISRGAKSEAVVVVAELSDGAHRGRGEAVPYARYGETPQTVTAQIESVSAAIRDGLDRTALQQALPAGAARNALDCAFWDLEAKTLGKTAWEIAGLPTLRPLITAFTLSLASVEEMAMAAVAEAGRPLLKLKLGRPGDPARIAALRRAAPGAQLIVDANEGWTPADLADNLNACAEAGVALVEQPLPASQDESLATIEHLVPICADESVHERASLEAIAGKYDAVNVKLDKAGGLTEALALAQEAERLGFALMVGCMVSTSLAMAPAMLVAQRARFVDLDGPLLLARDRAKGLRYDGSTIFPPSPELWG